MRNTAYTLNGTEVKVVNRTPAKVTYIRVCDGVRFIVGTKWFNTNAIAIR